MRAFIRLLGVVVACVLIAVSCSSSVTSVESIRDPNDNGMPGTATDDGPGNADPTDTSSEAAGGVVTESRFGGEFGWPLGAGVIDGSPVAPAPNTQPLSIDDEVRIGTLDNGMTYYVRSNDFPGGALSMRLAVNAGSVQQDVPDSGLAHFVEHMMFNGTESYPGNSMDRALQSIGAEIGPDFNAFTSSDETVYLLDLPSSEWDDIETGLDILFEWAHKATLAEVEVIAERGVVREEVRLRDEGPSSVIDARFDAAYNINSRYIDTDPAGTGERVLATTAEDVRRYYDRWYRPDRMAIIAVGDVSAGDLEQAITERFSQVTARDGQPVPVDPAPLDAGPGGFGLITEPVVDVLAVPDFDSAFISVDWSMPVWDESTVGGERYTLIEHLMADMLDSRLDEQVALGTLELFDPFVGRFDWNRERAFLGLNANSPDLAAGTTAILAEFVRAAVTGFSEDELARAAKVVQSQVDEFEATSTRLADREFADAYFEHFLVGSDISSVDDSVDRTTEVLASIGVDEVNDHFAWVMSSAAPLVIVVGPSVDGEADSALPSIDALTEAVAAAVPAGLSLAEGGDNYSVLEIDRLVGPGPSVEALDIDAVEGLDRSASEITFANGARVFFAKSKIDEGTVTLVASAEGGWSELEPGDGAIMPVVVDAVTRSGLGNIDAVSIDRYLGSAQAGAVPYIDQIEEGFLGNSSRDGAEVLFQLLHLYVTAPSVEGPALAQAKEDARDLIRSVERDPGTALTVAANGLRYGDDPWQRIVPTAAEVEALTAEQALDLFTSRLGHVDDLVVVIVGDIDEQTVVEFSERYIGTLPAGPADTYTDVLPPPPPGIVSERLVSGSPGSAGALSMWYSVPAEITAEMRLEIDVLDQIVNTRLFETIREELAATYGGSLWITPVVAPDELVESRVLIEGDPDRIEEIRESVLAELDDLVEVGPTQDEFDRAITVTLSDYSFFSNHDIIDQIFGSLDAGGQVFTSLERLDFVDGVVAADIQQLAAQLFPADQRTEVIRVPQAD